MTRIVHVGDRQRCDSLVICDEDLAANILEPIGMIRAAFVGRAAHHPKRQLLACLPSLFQNTVEHVVGDLALLGFQFTPTPAGVVNSRRNPRGQVFVIVRRPVECLPAHARIGQDFVRLLGNHSHPRSLICQGEGQPTKLTDRCQQ